MRAGPGRWLARLGIFILVIAGITCSMVGRIDRTPLAEQDFYTRMLNRLDTIKPKVHSATQPLQSAWRKVNITPDYPMPIAGYRNRPAFKSVHDSLYVRVIVLNNGSSEAILVSADLLIFPPALKAELERQLAAGVGPSFIYYGATHTHNGLGGWHPSRAAQLAVGAYHDAWVSATASAIVQAIKATRKELLPTHTRYWEADAKDYAANRLKPGNPYDGKLRGIKLSKADSAHAYLVTFSAHATSISSKSTTLSGDYPAALIQNIEQVNGNFGMFMAGMVGSHRLDGITETEFAGAEQAGKILAGKVLQASREDLISSDIKTLHLPIEYGGAQLRLNKDYKLRNWIFASALDPLKGELTCLQLGQVLLVGTPCDFSGEIYVTRELEAEAARYNKHLIVTSFNGDYTGYITDDVHYETSLREEVTTMNWVGPYFGGYFTEMIRKVIAK
ncbi:MAG: neutral/alkaline non-lysosomal ceramidase N-terminal domain-containing protein [Cyclobacteriaceae bacterium]|nr:neutral/alkaline non-lysosomal ceramidase N-terminal domain-containing protein [Cyclobacteriaceae bacterium]